MNIRCESRETRNAGAPRRLVAACAIVLALAGCSRGFSAPSAHEAAAAAGGASADAAVAVAAAQQRLQRRLRPTP